MKLVNERQIKDHLGHQWRNTGSSTLLEDIKILWWMVTGQLKRS
jgi:hypothetical protein